jgi:hypothetical protein
VVDLVLRPDPAMVACDQSLHRREADACSPELGGAMQALEGLEQPVRVRHVEARAIVPYVEGRLVGRAAADFDARVGAPRGELLSVADQVDQHDLEQAPVAPRAQAAGDLDLDGALRVGGAPRRHRSSRGRAGASARRGSGRTAIAPCLRVRSASTSDGRTD